VNERRYRRGETWPSGAKPFEPTKGRPMAEYVPMPRQWLAEHSEARMWVATALNWAAGLPPRTGGSKTAKRPQRGSNVRGSTGAKKKRCSILPCTCSRSLLQRLHHVLKMVVMTERTRDVQGPGPPALTGTLESDVFSPSHRASGARPASSQR